GPGEPGGQPAGAAPGGAAQPERHRTLRQQRVRVAGGGAAHDVHPGGGRHGDRKLPGGGGPGAAGAGPGTGPRWAAARPTGGGARGGREPAGGGGIVRAADETWTWATVASTVPLRVRLDGDDAPLLIAPENLAGGLREGDRVWTQRYGRRLILHRAPTSRTAV